MTHNRNIIRIALATGFLLLLPFVAMQFSDEAAWSLSDFVLAGALLFGSGLTFELLTRKVGNFAYRAALCVALGAALFLVWANLSLGIIGSESNPLNLMYFGVLALGLIGAGIARFRPRGMAFTLFAMAIALVVVAVIALIAWVPRYPERSSLEIVIHNGLFVALFSVSGFLFQKAAQ